MNPITIITIVVVALLTVIIFGLAWLAWSSCIKAYKVEVDQGKHDTEIFKEYHSKKKNKGGLIGLIGSYLALLALSGLFVSGIVYKASGENFTINNQTALVIKSGSMSGFYDDELAEQYQLLHYDPTLQFGVGDICVFEKVSNDTELAKGEVYGYKYKNIIITHRLIDETEDGLYQFRGDNNPVADQLLVTKDNIVYHYTGSKVPGIGAFVLYAQSYFGIWSLVGIIGVTVSSEIVYHKVDVINKERDKKLDPGFVIEPPKQKIRKRGKKHEK